MGLVSKASVFMAVWALFFSLTSACQNREPQLGSGCETDVPKGLDLIDGSTAEETAITELSRAAPAVSAVDVERIDAVCLTTLEWYEEVLLEGKVESHDVPRSMPIWIIQVEGKSETARPWDKKLHYDYAVATVDAKTGSIMSQSYMFEPLLPP